MVGKYVQLHDAYLSVSLALIDAGYENGAVVNIKWINSEEITKDNVAEKLKGVNGIIVPGGFGNRGTEGMIETSKYAREKDIPYFGICYGLQIAAIDIARNVLGYTTASSTEIDPQTPFPIIDLLENQVHVENLGGTLRLGNYPCTLSDNSLAKRLYNEDKILERHRHRYEFNNKYRGEFRKAGVEFSGINEELDLVEILELPTNKFFLGCQFHPEFKSRPNHVHPLFKGFIKAALENK